MFKYANFALIVITITSSLVTAFALACLTYTFYTGELPFDLQPIFPVPQQVNMGPSLSPPPRSPSPGSSGATLTLPTTPTGSISTSPARETERSALVLFQELKKKEEELEKREASLVQLQKELEAKQKTLDKLQMMIRQEAEDIRTRLEIIARRDLLNIQNQAKLLEEIEPKAAAKLILEWEKDPSKNVNGNLAPRVLYYMKKEKSAQILTTILKENDPEKNQMVAKITETMRRLAPEEEAFASSVNTNTNPENKTSN